MPFHRIFTVSRFLLHCNRVYPVPKSNFQFLNKCRYCMMEQPKKPASALKKEKAKFHSYIVQRYLEYVKNYTALLEKRFPTAMKMYRVFSLGIKDFLKDLKTYISLQIRLTRDQGFSKMTRQEIELCHKMPSDMLRIAPVLILSAVPFGNYIIFPLAFLKPRTLLCSHFWSIQQKSEFSTEELRERLRHNKPVFRALQAKLHGLPKGELKVKWKRVIGLLGSGVHPTANDLVQCKELFTSEPYQLSNLSYAHLGSLLKIHGVRRSMFRQNKLKYWAFLLLEMDKAIIREGGVETLNTEALRNICHIRGLNGAHLNNQDMREWLKEWLLVSQNCDKSSYSLLLHSPILLAYNHPQNWVLIY